MTSFVQKTCEKKVVGIVIFVPDWFTSPPITLLLILQWHTKVSEETFNVKMNLQEIANFGNCAGDFRL